MSHISIDKTVISALILSGGTGKRLSAQDKGLIQLQGKPLIAHVIEIFDDKVTAISINCNRNIETYQSIAAKYSLPIDCIRDASYHNTQAATEGKQSFLGPLAGIYSLLSVCKTEYAIIYPVDCPFFPTSIFNELTQHMLESCADACLPIINRHAQHLIVIVKKDRALQALLKLPNYGANLAVKRWLEQLQVETININTPFPAFININSKHDLLAAQRLFEKA